MRSENVIAVTKPPANVERAFGVCVQTRDTTIVQIPMFVMTPPSQLEKKVETVDEVYSVTGEAKRHPEDDPNPEVGILLATARAHERAAHLLAKRAQGLIKHADDVRGFTHKPLSEWQAEMKDRIWPSAPGSVQIDREKQYGD